MARNNQTQYGTAFTVSIEAAEGVTTGISAADRARTIQVAVAKATTADDIVQPGHVFPITAREGGVLVRAGHTEAGCDLAGMAGLEPSSVICEIMNDDGTMARLPDLIPFAQTHGLKVGTIADLIHYRAANESIIERRGSRTVRLPAGEFQLVVYRDKPSGAPHLALVKGTIDPEREVLVRVHEPVSVLDFLDEGTSAHSWPIPKALAAIAAAPSGVLVLLNCAEPADRLFAKFESLALASSEEGARQARMDLRTYGIGAQILRDLNVGQMKLLARPRKMPSMAGFGLHTTGFIER
jgi:3,4-dihydroxy 2-butanone 4-phosphate synthase/GTP cyclohydrolase II